MVFLAILTCKITNFNMQNKNTKNNSLDILNKQN